MTCLKGHEQSAESARNIEDIRRGKKQQRIKTEKTKDAELELRRTRLIFHRRQS